MAWGIAAVGSKKNRVVYSIVFALAFLSLNSVSHKHLLPEIRAWQAAREASKMFEEIRVFFATRIETSRDPRELHDCNPCGRAPWSVRG